MKKLKLVIKFDSTDISDGEEGFFICVGNEILYFPKTLRGEVEEEEVVKIPDHLKHVSGPDKDKLIEMLKAKAAKPVEVSRAMEASGSTQNTEQKGAIAALAAIEEIKSDQKQTDPRQVDLPFTSKPTQPDGNDLTDEMYSKIMLALSSDQSDEMISKVCSILWRMAVPQVMAREFPLRLKQMYAGKFSSSQEAGDSGYPMVLAWANNKARLEVLESFDRNAVQRPAAPNFTDVKFKSNGIEDKITLRVEDIKGSKG